MLEEDQRRGGSLRGGGGGGGRCQVFWYKFRGRFDSCMRLSSSLLLLPRPFRDLLLSNKGKLLWEDSCWRDCCLALSFKKYNGRSGLLRHVQELVGVAGGREILILESWGRGGGGVSGKIWGWTRQSSSLLLLLLRSSKD